MSQSRISLNVLWPILVLLAAGLWFFQALNGLPNAIIDLLHRIAPILLIAFGLMLLLGRRIRYGNLIAVVLSTVLAVGIVVMAYGQKTTTLRTDYAQPVNYAIAPSVTNLRLTIRVMQTEIELKPTDNPVAADKQVIVGNFLGSLESLVTTNYSVDGTTGVFTLSETPRNAIPSLDLIGRGKLSLTIPANLPIDQLTITGQQGSLTLDVSQNRLNRLSVNLAGGDIAIKFANQSGLIADLKSSGDTSVEIPQGVAAQIALRGAGSGAPVYSDAIYILDRSGTLVPKGAVSPQMQLTIDAGGRITVK